MSRPFAIESLESRLLLDCDPTIGDTNLDEWMRTAVRNSGPKVAQALTEVHDWAFDKVLAKPLPLIGAPFKGLKDGPKDKLRWLIDQVNKVVGDPNQLTLCPMSEKLKGAIDTAQASGAPAGPASAVSIAGITSSKVDPKIFERRPPDPNHPELIPAPLDAGFDIRLSGDLVDSTFEPAFDLGIPSLALKLEGGLKIKLSFDAHIIIGIDAHGWYLNTSPEGVDPELKLHLEVTAPNLTLTGSLGFLRATAKDNGTSLVTDMFVDAQDDADADTKLYFNQFTTIPQLLKEAAISGDEHLDLMLSLDAGGNAAFPALGANLVVDWGIPRTNLLASNFSLKSFGTVPIVQFKDVQLDLGTFMSRFLQPVLKTINDVLEPIRPVLNALRTPVPLLSDVAALREKFDQDGDQKVTLLEVFIKIWPDDLFVRFFRAADVLDQLVGGGKGLPTTSAVLHFGNFKISGDARSLARQELQNPDAGHIDPGTDPISTLPEVVKTVIDKLKNPDNFGSGTEGFKFPIWEDKLSIFGLFLGQPVNLVTYTTPKLSIGPTFDQTIPIFGPVAVKLFGGFVLNAQLSFGFDTFGLASWAADQFRDAKKIFNGLYVSDRASPNGTGDDVDELVVSAAVYAGLGVDLKAASAVVAGGISGELRLNLRDPNGDGKVRVSEIIDMAKQDPLCIVDAHGRIVAGLLVTGHILGIPFTKEFAQFELMKFDHTCDPPTETPKPDLVANSFTLNAPGLFNTQSRSYSLEVANIGTAAAGSARAMIYVSDDDQITPSDTPLQLVDIGSIAEGQTQTFTGQVNLPANPFQTDNQYYVGVIVDNFNAVDESDETNNVNLRPGTAPIVYSVESDLPSPSPTSAAAVQVKATALTLDTAAKAGLRDEIIGSADMDVFTFTIPDEGLASGVFGVDVDSFPGVNTYLRLYDASWNLLASNDDGLSPSENVNKGGESFIQSAARPGTYYAVVSAAGNSTGDPRLLTGRSSPTVSDAPYYITVLSDPNALPDLVPQQIVRTGGANSGLQFLQLTVKNEGTADAGRFAVRFFVSDDPDITPADNPVALSIARSLGAGQSMTFTESVDLGLLFGPDDPFRTDNDYYLGAIVNNDPSSAPIVEADTYNNSNRGLGIDTVRISSEADLPSPADGTVVARPLNASRFGDGRITDIGDEYSGSYDIDVFSFNVAAAGAKAQIDIDPLATALTVTGVKLPDSYLRLYDASWNLIAENDNGTAPSESESPVGSYIEHIFSKPGIYYAVVSSAANGAADPRALAGRVSGPKGGYRIDLTVTQTDPPSVFATDLGIQSYFSFTNTSFTSASPAASPLKDVSVDVFAWPQSVNKFDINYYLSDDASLSSDDALLKSVHHPGLLAAITTVHLTDQLALPPSPILTDNDYYVIMVLDPTGNVYEDGATGNNSAAIHVSADADLAGATPLAGREPAVGNVGLDEWAGPYDLDAYSFALDPGQTVQLDVDSARAQLISALDAFLRERRIEWTVEQMDQAITVDNYRSLARSFRGELPFSLEDVRAAGNLDAFVRLYDGNWDLLTSSDEAQAPDDPFAYRDPYLTWTTASGGTFYAVVGPADAPGNDPRALAGRRAGTSQGGYSIGATFSSAGSIIGNVFDDANATGEQDRGERGLAGVTVYLDANRNGVYDAGETRAASDAAGRFAFGGLGEGVYNVGHVAPEGYVTTAPRGGTARVSVSGVAGEGPFVAFGDAALYPIDGLSFDDANADGRQGGGEPALAGRLVYDDVNGNGVADRGEPWALTDESGAFQLMLRPGTHRIREEVPAAWRATAPGGAVYELKVGAEEELPPLVFGSTRTVSLSGIVFNDLDADGVWDSDEPGLAGRQVFLDANGNGAFDPATERSTTTSPAGQWSFTGLLPGRFAVAEVRPSDWVATTPAGGTQLVELEAGQSASELESGDRFAGAAVSGRRLFYNNSFFDGFDRSAAAADDNAIASDKLALLPAQTATFANVSSFSRGINGIMLDVARLPADVTPGPDDFVIRVASSLSGPWTDGPAPVAVEVRRGAGANGSDRVTLIWRDSSVRNKWLEVTAKANGRTGLPRPDRFYFASLPGETGNDPAGLRVDLLDLVQLTRANRLARGAAITSRYDFNRDGRVGALDFAVARANLFRSLGITAPAPASAAAISVAAASSTLRTGADRSTGAGGILEDTAGSV